MSLVLPFLETTPVGVRRVTAPVLTSYWEVTLGLRMLLPGRLPGLPGRPEHEEVSLSERALFNGRAADKLSMASVMAEVEKCILEVERRKLNDEMIVKV